MENLAGDKVKLPTHKGTQPCFGQRQGYCKNMASWRILTKHLLLHWCDECKQRPNVQKLGEKGTWTELENVQ